MNARTRTRGAGVSTLQLLPSDLSGGPDAARFIRMIVPDSQHPAHVPERRVRQCPAADHVLSIIAQHRDALRNAAGLLSSARVTSEATRHLIAENVRLRADARESLDALRAAMLAFGASLKAEGVRPEHLVPAVRVIMRSRRAQDQVLLSEPLRSHALGWAIEGYYATVPDDTQQDHIAEEASNAGRL